MSCTTGAITASRIPASAAARIEAMRGKVLGGSSSINITGYTRGDRGDYDRWAQKGALGWSYEDVLPYFKRCETWEGGANDTRGGEGPIGVEYSRVADPLYDAWVEAGRAAGYPVIADASSGTTEGFARSQYTIRNGRRSSAAVAYLKPVLRRKNLEVRTKVLTTKVVSRATAPPASRSSSTARSTRIHADREVILSGGAFNSPQLLMLSGIGPGGTSCARWASRPGRPAGRHQPAGPSRCADSLRPQGARPVPRT